ncbi:MAG: ATP-dependent RecD-like DNA helicase [Chlamydiales bacterium]|nr:ATP-dependent RecD-like DNA helicase [Chlamydiales bacterium]
MTEEHLSGSIDHIVYFDEESGFGVAHLKNASKELKTCITGTFTHLHPGEVISCTGKWIHHPSYGRQFSVSSYDFKEPQNVEGIQRYLESGLIKGIGPTYAKKIVRLFKEKTLEIIDNQPNRLLEIEGIGEKKLEKIIACWQDQKHVRKVMLFLRSHNISTSLAQKIYKRFGDNSIDLLTKNPYAIAREMLGVGFKTADKIAQSLGTAADSPQRISCAIEHTLQELADEGHTCYPTMQLIEEVGVMIEVDKEKISHQLQDLGKEERIKISSMDSESTPYVWLTAFYASELGISNELKRLIESDADIRSVHVNQAIDWVEKELNIKFAEEQSQAIHVSLKEKLSIITGGPGTGKSTITHAIVTIFSQLSENILLAAPTGKAAKRMTEINKKKAFTIHSLLEFDFASKGFKRNRKFPLECDLIIIDEASMIDTFLMYHLLKAIPSGAKVIFIGDIDQLPSVGAGNILKDLINSGCIPTVMLKEIFRQAKGSKIITNAHRINHGMFPDTSNGNLSDFIFIQRDEQEDIVKEILSLVKNRLPSKKGYDPIEDIQVLSPMRKGIVGIENLNHVLQKELNQSEVFVEKMGRKFFIGDKVMQIRNNYTKKVYNGDVGIIEDISADDEELIVSFDQKDVPYDFTELDELVLSYACSIHKYQGSECPCVIMPIHTAHFKLLYRNLLYTGITRGKKLVIVIGTKKALAIGIKNEQVQKRHTGLVYAMQQVLVLIRMRLR